MASFFTRAPVICALTACVAAPAMAQKAFKGKVTAVKTGDTLIVLRGKAKTTVWLYGVDAPAPATSLGAVARRLTHGLVLGKVVTVKPRGKARPGGVVAGISVERTESMDLMNDGSHRPVVITRFLAEELLKAGLARWDRKQAPGAKRLRTLEAVARTAGRGIWGKAPVEAAPSSCYKKCLDQSRARAISWAAIKAECRGRCKPAPPVRARSKDRACKRNRDCVVEYDPCGYRNPPCEDTWKPAVNRAADRRKRQRWANKKPACRDKSLCRARPRGSRPGRWLGTWAVCLRGQCVIRP